MPDPCAARRLPHPPNRQASAKPDTRVEEEVSPYGSRRHGEAHETAPQGASCAVSTEIEQEYLHEALSTLADGRPRRHGGTRPRRPPKGGEPPDLARPGPGGRGPDHHHRVRRSRRGDGRSRVSADRPRRRLDRGLRLRRTARDAPRHRGRRPRCLTRDGIRRERLVRGRGRRTDLRGGGREPAGLGRRLLLPVPVGPGRDRRAGGMGARRDRGGRRGLRCSTRASTRATETWPPTSTPRCAPPSFRARTGT